MGISFDTAQYCVCSSNTINGASQIGLEIAKSTGCTYSANTVNGGGILAHGIYISNTGAPNTNNVLIGNTLLGIAGNGIYGTNDPDYLTILGNRIEIVAAANAIELYGADNVSITGNTISHTVTVTQSVYLSGCSNVSINGGSIDGGGVVNRCFTLVETNFVPISGVTISNFTGAVIGFSTTTTLTSIHVL